MKTKMELRINSALKGINMSEKEVLYNEIITSLEGWISESKEKCAHIDKFYWNQVQFKALKLLEQETECIYTLKETEYVINKE